MGNETSGGGPLRPIYVDLGKRRLKRIKQLKRGEGPLPQEVAGVIERVKQELSEEELAGRAILPVVVIYQAKRKRRRPRAGPALPIGGS